MVTETREGNSHRSGPQSTLEKALGQEFKGEEKREIQCKVSLLDVFLSLAFIYHLVVVVSFSSVNPLPFAYPANPVSVRKSLLGFVFVILLFEGLQSFL